MSPSGVVGSDWFPSPLQVLRYLLPAAGVPEQDDAHARGSDDRQLLGDSRLHLLPAHHAGLEQHRHRPPGEGLGVGGDSPSSCFYMRGRRLLNI